ncbi:MAG: hypothetical protein ACEQSR_11885 [Candidatus Methylacidiphilales bacterium]
MKTIKIYYPKVRYVFSIFFFLVLLLIIIAQFPHFLNKYIDVLCCLLLVIAIVFNVKRLLKPAVIIDSDKISFPLANEWVYWQNIDNIRYYNIGKTDLCIEIKVKQMDKNRKKYKAPLVFADYDENCYPDLSLYRIDLENFKIIHEQFYKTIMALSKKNKAERVIEINNYNA